MNSLDQIELRFNITEVLTHMISKALATTTTKMNELDFIKIKHFCASKDYQWSKKATH